MKLLDELKAVVQQAGKAGSPTPRPMMGLTLPVEVLAEARRELFAGLKQRAETTGGSIRRLHRRWSAPGFFEAFVRAAWAEFVLGIAEDELDAQLLLQSCVHRALEGEVDPDEVEANGLEGLKRLEVARIAALALKRATTTRGPSGATQIASELGLVRERSGRITRAGEIFLDLAGAEAVAWLVHLSVRRSTGPEDSWRIHRDIARLLLDEPERIWAEYDWAHVVPGEPVSPTRDLILLLDALKLLRFQDERLSPDEDAWGWILLPLGKRVLTGVLADPPLPMHLLARAVISDDVSALNQPDQPAGPTAVKVTADYSRMVAHEIRNAIVPIRSALERLARPGQLDPTERAQLAARAHRGLERLEGFAAEVARVAEQEPGLDRVSVALLLEEAIIATAHETNGHVRVQRRLLDAQIFADRQRLVLAFVNLIRNAAQVGPTLSTLDITMSLQADRVLVSFEDNGPGVPPESVERIFQRGVSLRGGSGLGLAFVVEVVQDDLGGRVEYAPPDGGGAGFQLSLPLAGGGVS